MTDERYLDLMDGPDTAKLTQAEMDEGWHFCAEWDGLLVGPGMSELEPCHCLPKDHKVYKTTPPQEESGGGYVF